MRIKRLLFIYDRFLKLLQSLYEAFYHEVTFLRLEKGIFSMKL